MATSTMFPVSYVLDKYVSTSSKVSTQTAAGDEESRRSCGNNRSPSAEEQADIYANVS